MCTNIHNKLVLLNASYHCLQTLVVIVPGVNLPANDIVYLLPAVLFSAIVHELGHAVAAAR